MRVFHWILIFAASLMLAACGGGDKVPYCGPGVPTCSSGGGDGGGSGTTGAPTLVLSISSTDRKSASTSAVLFRALFRFPFRASRETSSPAARRVAAVALPMRLGLIVAALCGILAGVMVERCRKA